jgi:hypothetical protein
MEIVFLFREWGFYTGEDRGNAAVESGMKLG